MRNAHATRNSLNDFVRKRNRMLPVTNEWFLRRIVIVAAALIAGCGQSETRRQGSSTDKPLRIAVAHGNQPQPLKLTVRLQAEPPEITRPHEAEPQGSGPG